MVELMVILLDHYKFAYCQAVNGAKVETTTSVHTQYGLGKDITPGRYIRMAVI